MSFILDVSLILVLLIVVWISAKRSIFSSLSGAVAAIVAVTASLFVAVAFAPTVSQHVVTPIVERHAANELADMFSAPHLSNGRDTVRQFLVHDLVYEEPEAYVQLLKFYNVSAEEVREAYRTDPGPDAVLTALTADCINRFSLAIAFAVSAAAIYIVLCLIARRIEENFPPQRRYRGLRKTVPALVGIVSGFVWCWAAAQVLGLVLPAISGMQMFFTPEVLSRTDIYAALTAWDPFVTVQNLF